MNKTDISTKLAATEANLQRWETRLKRATTKVTDLGKQRRRLQLALLSADVPVIATVKVKVPKTVEATADLVQAIDDSLTEIIEGKPADDDTLPDFLNRADPLIAEKMTAARKKAEEAARHAMPLSGSAAAAYIKKGKQKNFGGKYVKAE